MQVSKAVEEFMFSLVNKSQHTKRSYRYALNLFATWCQDNSVELETIKVADIRRYMEWLQQRGLSINSIHHIILTIKSFLRWCAKEEELFEAAPSEKWDSRTFSEA